MKIAVIGAGYVGLVSGACFAELGNQVTCIDINPEKINALNQGIMPIYEPGLEALISTNTATGRLQFATSLKSLSEAPQLIFIAVGTPNDDLGETNLEYVFSAARDIGQYIKSYTVIVHKSTVPVGMADQVSTIIEGELLKLGLDVPFDMVSNPEFLREGAAIDDFMQPDRVIIGCSSKKAKQLMLDLYLPLMRNQEKIYFMNVKDAEMTKYVANAMLASRISFMNEMAMLCERLNVDVENVRMGVGADARIGSAFLYPGCGYGGSCFPKDIKALIKMAEKNNFDPLILKSVEKRNELQKNVLFEKIQQAFGKDLTKYTFAVWGLSFKPDTDDMREASSLVLLSSLINQGAKIKAYDPVAMSAAAKILPPSWFSSGHLQLVEHQYEALDQTDALILVTEWKPFRYPDLHLMKKKLRQPYIFDGRNQFDLKQMKESGFIYAGIGRRLTGKPVTFGTDDFESEAVAS